MFKDPHSAKQFLWFLWLDNFLSITAPTIAKQRKAKEKGSEGKGPTSAPHFILKRVPKSNFVNLPLEISLFCCELL